MKKIKLFPSPHVKVTIFISDQMKQDMKECWRRAFESGKDCDACSWKDVTPFGTGMCEQEEVIQKVLDKPGDMSRYIYSGNKRKHRVIKNGKQAEDKEKRSGRPLARPSVSKEFVSVLQTNIIVPDLTQIRKANLAEKPQKQRVFKI